VVRYIPSRGDIIWLNFTPQTGHELSGRRPAFVVSPKSYNEKVGLGIFCPIMSQAKDYPFEVKITENQKISGVILTDQIKNLDWKARDAEFIFKMEENIINEVLNKIRTLIT
jgi:mRNA interferase MazF